MGESNGRTFGLSVPIDYGCRISGVSLVAFGTWNIGPDIFDILAKLALIFGGIKGLKSQPDGLDVIVMEEDAL